MLNRLILSVAATTTIAISAFAFDGERKGFAFGGGIGVAPVATSSLDVHWVFREDDKGVAPVEVRDAALALNMVMGYFWNEKNLLGFESNMVSYTFREDPREKVWQGFNGIVWYHYTKWGTRRVFTTLGCGLYLLDISGSFYGKLDPGFGILVGAGIELIPHLQLSGSYARGWSSEETHTRRHTGISVPITHKHLSVLVSAMAF